MPKSKNPPSAPPPHFLTDVISIEGMKTILTSHLVLPIKISFKNPLATNCVTSQILESSFAPFKK